jgi:transposase
MRHTFRLVRVVARRLVDNELWAVIEPLLPKWPRRSRRGRPRTPDRIALMGIVFVLRTGVPWEDLPQEVGCTGMTCWKRLRDWQEAGLWRRVHQRLLERLQHAGAIDWSRASVDSAHAPAKEGGAMTGPNPTDRGKFGSKHHVIVDRWGIPLAPPMLTASNVTDVATLMTMVDRIAPVRGRPGRPRRRPTKLHADLGYSSASNRRGLRSRGIVPRIARKGIESREHLGRYRWVAERELAWLHRFRRLLIRHERTSDIHEALLTLASILILWNAIRRLKK